jgi:hypothetical protein
MQGWAWGDFFRPASPFDKVGRYLKKKSPMATSLEKHVFSLARASSARPLTCVARMVMGVFLMASVSCAGWQTRPEDPAMSTRLPKTLLGLALLEVITGRSDTQRALGEDSAAYAKCEAEEIIVGRYGPSGGLSQVEVVLIRHKDVLDALCSQGVGARPPVDVVPNIGRSEVAWEDNFQVVRTRGVYVAVARSLEGLINRERERELSNAVLVNSGARAAVVPGVVGIRQPGVQLHTLKVFRDGIEGISGLVLYAKAQCGGETEVSAYVAVHPEAEPAKKAYDARIEKHLVEGHQPEPVPGTELGYFVSYPEINDNEAFLVKANELRGLRGLPSQDECAEILKGMVEAATTDPTDLETL